MVDTDPKSGRVSKFFIGFKAFEPGSKIFACSYSHLVQIIQVTSLSSFFEIFCFWIKWCSPLCPVMKQKRLNKCHFQKYLLIFWYCHIYSQGSFHIIHKFPYTQQKLQTFYELPTLSCSWSLQALFGWICWYLYFFNVSVAEDLFCIMFS